MSNFTEKEGAASGGGGAADASAAPVTSLSSDREDMGVMDYIRGEEEALKTKPPGIWTDYVEPEFVGKSLIYTETFRKMHLSWTVAESEPSNTYMGHSKSPKGVLVLHGAVENGDLPLLRALGHFNTNFDIEDFDNDRYTPLMLAIDLMNSYSTLSAVPISLSGGKIGYHIVEWLLQRGVNPNIGDIRGFTPLRIAVQSSKQVNKKTTADQKTWIDLCKLLLLHGANPKDLKHCACDNMQKILTNYSKELSSSKTTRPPPLCPCGKNELASDCHGGKDGGVPLHPRRYCFCKSRKFYENCCLPRRFYFRETLTKVYNPVIKDIITEDLKSFKKKMDGITKELKKKKNLDEAVIRRMNFVAGGIKESRETIIALVEDNKEVFDKCFRWCIAHKNNDFLYPRPWRLESTPVSKEEAARRMQVWNAMVDEYIEDASIADLRSGNMIEKYNKINITGSNLWKNCDFCSASENIPSTYRFCSRCKMVCYCSEDCQKSDWKYVHKGICGEDSQEEVIPSTRSMAFIYNATKALAAEDAIPVEDSVKEDSL